MGSTTAEAAAHRKTGSALLARGLLVAARDEFDRCLALEDATGDPCRIILVLQSLTKAAWAGGDLDAALGYLQRARALMSPEMPARTRFRVLVNLMMVHTEQGRLDEALEALHHAEELPEDDDPAVSLLYWLNRSVLNWRRQEWAEMLTASDRAYQCSLKVGEPGGQAMALVSRGCAHLEMGNQDAATADLNATLALADRLSSRELAYAYSEIGRLHYVRGDCQQALQAGRDALGALLTDVTGVDKEEVARVSGLFGAIFSTLGQRNLALKYLNRAAAYYSQLGLRAEWQRATASIGQVLAGPVRPARSQMQNEVQQLDFLTAVLDLTDDLESVDPYIRGHSERVAGLALLLGESCGLSEPELRTLSYAARLHDVGMVAVDTDLIHKEGPLTDAERNRIALHSQIGEEMLRPYGLPEAGLAAVRHHHEHYDGTGYPDALAGVAIPFLARLIAVVDVYDALTSERVYRSAMDHARAVEEMRAMAGKALDPDLVERFLALYQV